MKNNNTGLTIPNEVIALTNLGDAISLQVYPSVMVLKSTEMTALDVIQALKALDSITDNLYETLREKFSREDECDYCTYCHDFFEDSVDVPDWAKEVCGLEPNAKLSICAEEDSGRILLEPVDYEHDISDIDDEMLGILDEMGICFEELNESIMSEEIIYYA